METLKSKTPAKQVVTRHNGLNEIVDKTMAQIAEIVGSTLGPGGSPVLIERSEYNLPPVVTKDGVTVFRALGFTDAVAHSFCEMMRDASMRTATEAGDGPQPLWSKLLTPTGFVEMKDIQVGMDICGTKGSIQQVVGVYPKGQKEIVKITFEQGQTVECCEDHLWSITTTYGSEKVLTVREMLKDFKSTQADGSNKYKYFVPKTVTDFASRVELPLDPYFLGVLLGDGSLCDSGSIELSLGESKVAAGILDKLILPLGMSLYTTHQPEKHSYRVKIKGGDIREILGALGVRNTDSHSKFIPRSYLFSSPKNRERLLQGLIDTDGHINSRGRFEFSTVSEQLRDDFLFLCRSLGKSVYDCTTERKEGDGSYSKSPIYRISELKGCNHGLKIENICPTGKFTEMQCIKVSNPDSLYITDNFIVTHNTTTATILAEAFNRNVKAFLKKNPTVSPHYVASEVTKSFQATMGPKIRENSIRADLEGSRDILEHVARISGNGDVELAKAVMDCFDICGDDGNVTIIDEAGPSGYVVEKIEGFPITVGLETCCGRYSSVFVNDQGTQRCVMDNPVFILYFGNLVDIQTIYPLLVKMQDGWNARYFTPHNIVICATGFSETVLASLAANWTKEGALNIFPLQVPPSPIRDGARHFLDDLAAITGGAVVDPITCPLETADFEILGNVVTEENDNGVLIYKAAGIRNFEANRFRSTVIGTSNEDELLLRCDDVRIMAEQAGSQMDKIYLQERLAKLTGGIAKLKVIGSSNGEVKERRDRAEDAVCAVRGAIKWGSTIGGCWMLLKLTDCLDTENRIHQEVIAPSLMSPIYRLLENVGVDSTEIESYIKKIKGKGLKDISPRDAIVFDALKGEFVNGYDAGLLDSAQAVYEALKNSISIATVAGTIGGCVVYPRDTDWEKQDARDAAHFKRSVEEFDPNEKA
jgi:chaperonin GroEL (HSP60 family)